MNKRRNLGFVCFVVVVGMIFWVFDSIGQTRGLENVPVDINLESAKKSYIMGELVALDARITNTSKTDIPIVLPVSMESGVLQVYVAKGDQAFKKYSGPKWGIDETAIAVDLRPGASLTDSSQLLWNRVPEVDHLSPDWAARARKGLVNSYYVFEESGEYRIKIVFLWKEKTIQSNYVNITVKEPTGDDLAIWNVIKLRPDLGYFIQTGEPQANRPEGRQKAKDDLESLFSQYPNGLLSIAVQRSLESYATQSRKIEKAFQ